VKVETLPQPLYDRADSAARKAAQLTEGDVRGALPRRTGRTATDTHMVEVAGSADAGPRFELIGPPQLGPLEYGADVGDRRGPHMLGQHILERTMPAFGDHLVAELRA
jgi:hypothetical protein